MKILRRFQPRTPRRATLRDLYVFGILNVFRQHSVLRVWEPLREIDPATRTKQKF